MIDTGMIENRTFDEIEVGATASVTRTLSRQDIALFALVSGDVNPAPIDADHAAGDMFRRVIILGSRTAAPRARQLDENGHGE